MYILIAIAGLLMTSSAYFGMKTLTIISIISVPLIAILGGFSSIQALNSIGGIFELISYKPKETLAFGTALTMCVGSFISGGTLTLISQDFQNKKNWCFNNSTSFLYRKLSNVYIWSNWCYGYR